MLTFENEQDEGHNNRVALLLSLIPRNKKKERESKNVLAYLKKMPTIK